MKVYGFREAPLKVFGVPFFEKTKELRRLSPELMKEVESLSFFGRRCPGARVAFRTDSPRFTVRLGLETFGGDIGMSIYSAQSANVLIGERKNPRFAGLVNPPDPHTKTFARTFDKAATMEEITVLLPRNEIIADIQIEVEEGATVLPPTPYTHSRPMLFYGSSITEGGCCSNPFNAYTAILSQRLDADYYNFGFSGSAKGELAVADYINTVDMSVFVYDYDENAPTAEFLAATHEPFFKRIRERHPTLPVVMMSMPKAAYTEQNRRRREVIRRTFENARNSGDERVYFIDGERFYGEEERFLCSIDTVHPNSLGFYRMAGVIEPVLREILENT